MPIYKAPVDDVVFLLDEVLDFKGYSQLQDLGTSQATYCPNSRGGGQALRRSRAASESGGRPAGVQAP